MTRLNANTKACSWDDRAFRVSRVCVYPRFSDWGPTLRTLTSVLTSVVTASPFNEKLLGEPHLKIREFEHEELKLEAEASGTEELDTDHEDGVGRADIDAGDASEDEWEDEDDIAKQYGSLD